MDMLTLLSIFAILLGALLCFATVVTFNPFAGPRDRRLDREVDEWARDLVARGEREWSEAMAPKASSWTREVLASMSDSEAVTLVVRRMKSSKRAPVGARTVLGMEAYSAEEWGDTTSPYPSCDPHARTIAAHPETRASDDLYVREDSFGGAW